MKARVVVGIDGSAAARGALRWAAHEAKLRGADLDVVWAWAYPSYVDPMGGYYPLPSLYDDAEVDHRKRLDDELDLVLGKDCGVAVRAFSVCSSAAGAVLKHAEGAALMVVGSHGTSGWRLVLLGSTAIQCMHHAPCPIAVVRLADADDHEEEQGSDRKSLRDSGPIVVGVDGSVSSVAALRWAVMEAIIRKTSIEVVHCWQVPLMYLANGYVTPDLDQLRKSATTAVERAIAQATDGLTNLPGITTKVWEAPAGEALIAESKAAQIVVVGTRGHGGFVGLLIGSIATQVVTHSLCPTVIVS
jgi:nucleotide-binding universal stress UspA family protein